MKFKIEIISDNIFVGIGIIISKDGIGLAICNLFVGWKK